MFGIDLAAMKGKLIFYACIALVILGLGYGLKHYYDAFKTAEDKVEKLETAIKLIKESKAIDEETITDLREQLTSIAKIGISVANDTRTKVDDIKRSYGINDPSGKKKVQRDNEISTVRVQSLWDIYCFQNKTTKECIKDK